jgi:beta-lactamase regulating signal transducer with metallopeptidase domain
MTNPVEALFGSAGVDAIGRGLLHSLWQGVAIGMSAGGVLVLMRRSSAASRYAVAYSALLLMLGLPVATAALRHAAPVSAERSMVAITLPVIAPAFQSAAGTVPWLVFAWLIGVGALSLRVIGGWIVVRRMSAASGRPLSAAWQETVARLSRALRVSRSVAVVESALADVPSLVGWLRPVIFLPVSTLTGLGPVHLEAVLAHELAHVRRHDYLMNLAQAAIEMLLFYHPAVWWNCGAKARGIPRGRRPTPRGVTRLRRCSPVDISSPSSSSTSRVRPAGTSA